MNNKYKQNCNKKILILKENQIYHKKKLMLHNLILKRKLKLENKKKYKKQNNKKSRNKWKENYNNNKKNLI